MKRSKSETRFLKFKNMIEKKLFPDGNTMTIDWKTLYHKITGCGILASKTTIWNLFLDLDRKEKTEKQDKMCEVFKFDDLTIERTEFLWNMHESYENWKKTRVPRWKFDLIRGMFTRKFRTLNGCNCVISLIILIFTILFMVVSVFPMGAGIIDSFELCKIVVSIYVCCFLWYFCSLLGEDWYPRTYGGLVINATFMIASGVFCVIFSHLLIPSYYEDKGCFECPACSETPDKLCFEYSKFHKGINNLYAEANTCFCALNVTLRSNEPIIPYGRAEDYCAEEGDDCSCDAILRESPENWDTAQEPQEYFKCVYYSPIGTPFFFGFGTAIILGTAMMCCVSFLYFIYLLLLCVGCGRGNCKPCNICGVDLEKEQEEADNDRL